MSTERARAHADVPDGGRDEMPDDQRIELRPQDVCGCLPMAPAGSLTKPPVAPLPLASLQAADPPPPPVVPQASEAPIPGAATLPRRALKVVLTLQPGGADTGAAGRAVLAVGAEGCDPQLQLLPGADLAAALAAVPALVAAAEARWQTRPRFPLALPTPTPKAPARAAAASRDRSVPGTPPTPEPRPPVATDPAACAHAASAVPADPLAAAPAAAPVDGRKLAPAGQLSLFR